SRPPAHTDFFPLSLHDALPIFPPGAGGTQRLPRLVGLEVASEMILSGRPVGAAEALRIGLADRIIDGDLLQGAVAFANEIAKRSDRKSTRLNSSHVKISYAVFC